MSYIQKSKIKAFVNARGVRISPEAFDGINRQIEGLLGQMIEKVKADGMKTLMNQHTGAKKVAKASGNKCQHYPKCCNIKPKFLKLAKDLQHDTYQEAGILSRKV